MRQEINLYQAALIDKPEPLQTRQTVLLLLGFVVLLGVITVISFWQLHSRRQLLADLQQQERQRSAAVSQLERQYPQREKSLQLEEQIRQIEQRLTAQKQLIGYFSKQEVSGNAVILGSLEGLAKNVRKGVWLKRIQLDGSGQKVVLAGSALHPEQVPAYLQYLGQQGVFNGQVFSRLKLARLKERPGEVDFSLESQPEGKK